MRKLIPAGMLALLLIAFFWVVRGVMKLSLPESDLWWMMPAMHYYTDGKPALQVWDYLLGAWPVGFAQPILKIYLHIGTVFFGPKIHSLVALSALSHLISSSLVYCLGCRLGLRRQEAFVGGILFFCAFAHFHVFMWPVASQHLYGVMTILLLLTLYLETEKRWEQARPWVGSYWATLGVALAASLQRSTIVAVVLILFHLLFCAAGHQERLVRYRRWMWMAVLYMIYPVWVLTQASDPIITEVVRKLPLPALVKMMLVVDPVVGNPIPPWIRTVTALLGGTAVIGLGFLVLRFSSKLQLRLSSRQKWLLGLGLLAVLYWVWITKDSRQLFLAYNLSGSFMACLLSYLEPLKAVFLSRSTEPFHYLMPQVSPWSILLVSAAVLFFWRRLLPRNRSMLLLPAWLFVAVLLSIHQNSSYPLQTPSRYLAYFTPVAYLILAPMIVFFFERLVVKGRSAWCRDLALYGVVGLLGLTNIAAMGVASFRGRLPNTYLGYGDIRTAALAAQDSSQGEQVWVLNVLPMPIREQWADFPLAVPEPYDNLFFMARGLLGLTRIHGVRVGQKPPPGVTAQYEIKQERLLRREGIYADPFSRQLEQAIAVLERKEKEQARQLLTEAALERPFLLKYLLGDLRLLDLIWLTDGVDLQDWLIKVYDTHVVVGKVWNQKSEQTRAMASQDLSDYALCLFLIAYLDHEAGEIQRSKYGFSQIQLLDRDPQRLIERLGRYPVVKNDPEIARFLREKVVDPAFFGEPYFWKKEDYSFGRFLLRLIAGVDVKSSWDRRFSPPVVI